MICDRGRAMAGSVGKEADAEDREVRGAVGAVVGAQDAGGEAWVKLDDGDGDAGGGGGDGEESGGSKGHEPLISIEDE